MNAIRITREKNGVVHEENIPMLAIEDLYTPGEHAHARVTFTCGQGQEYGAAKMSVTVTYECDQEETRVNMAGQLAFSKAVELLGDGWKIFVGGPS